MGEEQPGVGDADTDEDCCIVDSRRSMALQMLSNRATGCGDGLRPRFWAALGLKEEASLLLLEAVNWLLLLLVDEGVVLVVLVVLWLILLLLLAVVL